MAEPRPLIRNDPVTPIDTTTNNGIPVLPLPNAINNSLPTITYSNNPQAALPLSSSPPLPSCSPVNSSPSTSAAAGNQPSGNPPPNDPLSINLLSSSSGSSTTQAVNPELGSSQGSHAHANIAQNHTLPQPATTSTLAPFINGRLGPAWRTTWWWWWELGSALLSMSAMFSIIIILGVWSGSALHDWKYRIQINSLIATLTTIGKTAMLVAVAESICQLKWLHFYQQPQRVSRFQDFDGASRGPWGSLVLLYSAKNKAMLASLGAVITILGLGIEPTAQQVLTFPSRNATRANLTATMGMADIYASRSVVQGDVRGYAVTTGDLLRLQSSIIHGITGTIDPPQFECHSSAAYCQWANFSTIGLCATYKNLTDYSVNCTYFADPEDEDHFKTLATIYCDYTSPSISSISDTRPNSADDRLGGNNAMRMWYDPINTADFSNQSMMYASFMANLDSAIITIKPKDIVRVDQWVGNTIAPSVDIEMISWDWCARHYTNVTASPGIIHESPYTSEFLQALLGNDSLRRRSTTPEQPAQTYDYVAPSTGQKFHLWFTTRDAVMPFFTGFLNTTIWTETIHTKGSTGDELGFGPYMKDHRLQDLAFDLADTITNQMRSQNGDNPNATFAQGDVFVTETYIRVRWPWLALALLETVFATALLLFSIVISRDRPLWKSSAIAPLVHGLEGWSDQELSIAGNESAGRLESLASRMTASLEGNEKGYVKFLRRK